MVTVAPVCPAGTVKDPMDTPFIVNVTAAPPAGALAVRVIVPTVWPQLDDGFGLNTSDLGTTEA